MPSMPSMTRSMLTGLVAVVVALAGTALTVVGAAPASALVCTRSWTGMMGTDWDNKDNWSPNDSAPTSEDVACIAGGTVSLDSGNNHIVGSIILDGIGNPTLEVAKTNNVTLMLVDQLYVGAGATLRVGGPDTHGTSIGPVWNNTTATFANFGTITFARPLTNSDPWQTPSNSLQLNGVNNGTITLASGRLDLPAQFTNNGTYATAADTLTWKSSGVDAIFDNAGTVTNGGIFHVPTSTWRQHGTTTGNEIVLRNQALLDDISGPGVFTLWTVHLKGTISANQTVKLGSGDGGAQITVDAPSTIAAGATVTSQLDGNGYALKGAPITNHGTLEINALPNSNGFRFEAPFVNAADGTVSLKTGRVDIVDDFTNAGMFATAADTTTWKSGETAALTQIGTIDNDGTFFVANTTWNQQGGIVGGDNPVIFRNQALLNDSGGTGELMVWTARFSGTVPAGQTIRTGTGDGGQQLTFDAPSTIATGGRIVSLQDPGGYTFSGKSLTNHGLLDVSSKPGQYYVLSLQGPLVNATDGTVAVHSGRLDTFDDGLVNHGQITVDPGAQIGIQREAGKLTNAADGILRFGIAGATDHGAVIGWGAGRVVPGGTIAGRLVGGYDPAKGTEFPVIQTAHDAGTFASVGGGFSVVYADDHIALRRGSASAAKHRTTLRTSAPARVEHGTRAKITATLTDTTTHRGVKAHRVTLWKRFGKKWVKVGARTTNAHGVASAKVKITRGTIFRWKFAGAGGLQASTSPKVTVRLRH